MLTMPVPISRSPSVQSLHAETPPQQRNSSSPSPDADYADTPARANDSDSSSDNDDQNINQELEQLLRHQLGACHVSADTVRRPQRAVFGQQTHLIRPMRLLADACALSVLFK